MIELQINTAQSQQTKKRLGRHRRQMILPAMSFSLSVRFTVRFAVEARPGLFFGFSSSATQIGSMSIVELNVARVVWMVSLLIGHR